MEIRKSVWANAEKTMIDLEINHPVFGWIPFTANPDDVEAHGRELFAMLAAGEAGPVADYVPPPAPVITNETPEPQGNGGTV